MGFADVLHRIERRNFSEKMENYTKDQVRRALGRERCDQEDFLALLSPAARPWLEEIAVRAQDISVRNFGRTMHLFTPMYLSNYCSNGCVYCGFACSNQIARKQLSLDEVAQEARAIAATGLRHILILTGEAPRMASLDYLESCCRILQQHFSSIAIEIYALDTPGYQRLVAAGVDGLTIYQETYNQDLYATLHPFGPKRDFHFRLDAPERGCRAGMRMVSLGALLGLDDWRWDSLCTGLHAAWLQEQHPEVEISVALPRMRPHAGSYSPAWDVSDVDFVQILLALRLFLPRCGISISTRERAWFRNKLISLGVTRMSAGVSTAVGGHGDTDAGTGQFAISDERSVAEMAAAIMGQGYQPVYQDWRDIRP